MCLLIILLLCFPSITFFPSFKDEDTKVLQELLNRTVKKCQDDSIALNQQVYEEKKKDASSRRKTRQ